MRSRLFRYLYRGWHGGRLATMQLADTSDRSSVPRGSRFVPVPPPPSASERGHSGPVVVRCGRFVRAAVFGFLCTVSTGFDRIARSLHDPESPCAGRSRRRSHKLTHAPTELTQNPPSRPEPPSPAPHSSQPIVRNSTPCTVTITKERHCHRLTEDRTHRTGVRRTN